MSNRDYNIYDETGIGDREIVGMVVPAVVDAMDYLYGDERFSAPPDSVVCYEYITMCASHLASDILTKNDHHSPSASALKWLESYAAKSGALKEEEAKAVAACLGEFKTLIASTDHVSFDDYQLLKAHAYREESDGDDCPYWIINHPVGVQLQPYSAPCWADSLQQFGLSPRLIANVGQIVAMGYGAVLFHEDGDLVKGLPCAGDKI
ncbi:hypothetical protein MA12_gp22 [Pectobacterium phage MA12]|uniref:DUF5983 domain-containing protein n=1 Tax=Pectobacterium phage MA12 TaxID=2686474 RepID=A0A6B9RJ67_9CAUD|nr:hypothetical protein JT356_gp06 [Pectobacterium phage MA11]YP_010000244.1 hypothetical protein JT357_gp22 [Pectobacterium phage MA12]QGF21031.1 hypothetical protein MA11_gp06 [Pectobacterium phage MA11]QHI00849.1 hypothetical protein MA12_gp22 [Pectobacterium phage MA12]